ncbi:MAG TPA: M28 family peptidase, partial [Cyclobacteriaceae bacterium]|nr:M28 family peptidase [Cyclobacteriaceae bacterium]
MKNLTLSLLALLIAVSVNAQKKSAKSVASSPVNEITALVTKSDAEAHLTFLAADEMRGRNTGSPELEIAANYIASNFKQWGIKPAPGTNNTYFQTVEFQKTTPPSAIEFVVDGQTFKLKEDVVQLAGSDVEVSGSMAFVGYGSRTDFEKTDVKGKIVVAFTGSADDANIMRAFLTEAPSKNTLTREFGGVALVEINAIPGIPWQNLAGFLGAPRTSLKKEATGVPHFWMKNSDVAALNALKETKAAKGSLKSAGATVKYFNGRNVAGVVEGTDPVLKNEYIIVSAHYDHVGVTKRPNQEDSIYNGARDNAIGTVGMMQTARFFGKYPQKRSVLLLALTAEEAGLLGSAWYSDHPLIPLKQTVFNFNCDGAGYNDTSIATVIGMERTTAEPEIAKASEAFGLKAAVDPVPEQNLYERSDNYNFAKKGIPAINFAPGTKAFDAE